MTDSRNSFDDKGLLKKDLLKMLEQGSLNDVRIKLSDGELVANKDILMARSDYFATMFGNTKFIEGETSSVYIGHCSKAVMERIIKYFFSGSVTFDGLSLAQLLELSHTSEMMLLSKFKDKVDSYLRLDIIRGGGKDGKFLPELILGAKDADLYNLSSIGLDIMFEVFLNLKDIPNDVSSSGAFKSLSSKVIREITMNKSTLLLWRTLTNKQRFDFMIWLSENANEVSKEDKKKIAENFNLEDFTVDELMTSVKDSGFYSGTQIDQRVLEIVKIQELKIQEQNLKIQQQRSIIDNSLPDKYKCLFK